MVRVGRQLPQAVPQRGLGRFPVQRLLGSPCDSCSSSQPEMDDALLPENLVRLVDCVQIDAKGVREFTNGWQFVAGGKSPSADLLFDLTDDLAVDRLRSIVSERCEHASPSVATVIEQL